MTDAGRRVVEAAKADGSWTLLDDVEDLVVPPDLAAAFDAVPGSREQWEAFPRSAKRGILEWSCRRRPRRPGRSASPRPPSRPARRAREPVGVAGPPA
jgi:uncharacterized protein YdeI (YjbR/CyaY-like superfamily)